jgi:N-acetylglutamate synthase-like GNAT family acetyltransferase
MMTGSKTRVTIRRAELKDIPGVIDCLAAAFEPYRQSYTPDGFRDTVLTAEDAQRRLKEMTILIAEHGSSSIIGSLSYQVFDSCEGHLRGMAVIPEFQGKGVAERMLWAAEADLRGPLDSIRSMSTRPPELRRIGTECRCSNLRRAWMSERLNRRPPRP